MLDRGNRKKIIKKKKYDQGQENLRRLVGEKSIGHEYVTSYHDSAILYSKDIEFETQSENQ